MFSEHDRVERWAPGYSEDAFSGVTAVEADEYISLSGTPGKDGGDNAKDISTALRTEYLRWEQVANRLSLSVAHHDEEFWSEHSLAEMRTEVQILQLKVIKRHEFLSAINFVENSRNLDLQDSSDKDFISQRKLLRQSSKRGMKAKATVEPNSKTMTASPSSSSLLDKLLENEKEESNAAVKPTEMSTHISFTVSTELHDAAKEGNLAALQECIQKGEQDVNSGHGAMTTALHWAAWQGDVAVAEALVANKADINARNTYGYTPIHWAAHRGNRAVLQCLLDNQADIDTVDSHGSTPLHWAATGNQVVCALTLLEAGADIDVQNHHKETALHWAASEGEYGFDEMIELLIKAGADTTLTNMNDRTAADLALHNKKAKAFAKIEDLQLLGIQSLTYAEKQQRDKQYLKTVFSSIN
eukprot:m.63924 g.63924  ORF g.63924 m.63924 type:complete len:414 (-) comp11612_c0_seq3:63-1304(-)